MQHVQVCLWVCGGMCRALRCSRCACWALCAPVSPFRPWNGLRMCFEQQLYQPAAAAVWCRVGRTGRAGNKGTAITFISAEEEQYAPDLVKALKDSGSPVPDDLMVRGGACAVGSSRIEGAISSTLQARRRRLYLGLHPLVTAVSCIAHVLPWVTPAPLPGTDSHTTGIASPVTPVLKLPHAFLPFYPFPIPHTPPHTPPSPPPPHPMPLPPPPPPQPLPPPAVPCSCRPLLTAFKRRRRLGWSRATAVALEAQALGSTSPKRQVTGVAEGEAVGGERLWEGGGCGRGDVVGVARELNGKGQRKYGCCI